MEHLYNKSYQGLKIHYYPIRIGHMVSQVMRVWEKIWTGIRQRCEKKHWQILGAFKEAPLEKRRDEIRKRIQI